MAYDKVVDSTVLNAGLKSIADAIREKAGTSGNLAFPTAMAEAIAAIEAGGGDPTVITGTFTPSESLKEYTITHNLGKKPHFVMIGCLSGATPRSSGTAAQTAVMLGSIHERPFAAYPQYSNGIKIYGNVVPLYSEFNMKNILQVNMDNTNAVISIESSTIALTASTEYGYIVIGGAN